MALVKDSFIDLERHKQLLGKEVDKLRNALQQWQAWEAEYELLKGEVTSLPTPVSQRDLARIRRDFDGLYVVSKEVDEIFGRTALRPAEQIVNVLSRRLDYVVRNVETLEKQVQAAENRLAAATIISQPDVRDEEGLPLTDIMEQLDEDGNVVSYYLQTPSDTQPQVLEALKKAGIEDLPEIHQPPQLELANEVQNSVGVAEVASPQETLPAKRGLSDPTPKKRASRKGVSFAEDTKPGHDAHASSSANQYSKSAQRLEQIMKAAKDQEKMVTSSAVIPEDESPEDAAWRREALEYGLSEIGPVVAELRIEEDSGDDSDPSYDDSDEEEDEDDAEEDRYGRSKYSIIGDDYRQRMMALEAKLGIKSFFAAQNPERDTATAHESGHQAVVGEMVADVPDSSNGTGEAGETGSGRKGVKFVENLDISPGQVEDEPAERKTQPQIEPLGDVVERGHPAEAAQAKPPKKISRFKMGRAADPSSPHTVLKGPDDAPLKYQELPERRIAPSGPEGTTLVSSIVERAESTEAKEPDDLDATLLHQEVAVEYHRKRTQLIGRQGGFVKENEPAISALEEGDGEPKRVSRFKAARLSTQ